MTEDGRGETLSANEETRRERGERPLVRKGGNQKRNREEDEEENPLPFEHQLTIPPQTGTERLIWGQGQPSSLRAVTTTIRGIRLTLAAAICWENYMPLLRQSLYSQNVNLYLAPTADARDTWLPLMRTVACEGRCVVLSANQCMRRENLPSWITGGDAGLAREMVTEVPHQVWKGRKFSIIEDGNEIALPCPKEPLGVHTNGTAESPLPSPSTAAVSFIKERGPKDFVSRGGSCIVSPQGQVLAGPLWEEEDGFLWADVDMEDCLRGRLDLDVGGHYSRSDSFHLSVEGLDLSPPP